MTYGSQSLRTDSDKVSFIINTVDLGVLPNVVLSTQRIGKPTRDKPQSRPLKVSLSDRETKFRFLNNRKNISSNNELKRIFHNRIFVNGDSSFLIQKEDFRLRQRLREIKMEDPNSRCYIRSGRLFVDGHCRDEVDVKNQLF